MVDYHVIDAGRNGAAHRPRAKPHAYCYAAPHGGSAAAPGGAIDYYRSGPRKK